MEIESLKKTPLYDKHIELGAKMVPFAGWAMPVSYTPGALKEHTAVRTDVSNDCGRNTRRSRRCHPIPLASLIGRFSLTNWLQRITPSSRITP